MAGLTSARRRRTPSPFMRSTTGCHQTMPTPTLFLHARFEHERSDCSGYSNRTRNYTECPCYRASHQGGIINKSDAFAYMKRSGGRRTPWQAPPPENDRFRPFSDKRDHSRRDSIFVRSWFSGCEPTIATVARRGVVVLFRVHDNGGFSDKAANVVGGLEFSRNAGRGRNAVP
ncbi:MAG: hypothetical protein KatS3mg110_3970 [Pirellulaceae bacterium]|nr:MAG: hypothetical protein KatS3mg110_3970 [Pirellulaceae bacterium]